MRVDSLDAESVQEPGAKRSDAPGSTTTTNADPEGVAQCQALCDPFRVGIKSSASTGGVAPGYYISRLRREEIGTAPFTPKTPATHPPSARPRVHPMIDTSRPRLHCRASCTSQGPRHSACRR